MIELLQGRGGRLGQRAEAAANRESFEWKTQWRFYLNHSVATEHEGEGGGRTDGKCLACIGGGRVSYGFELLGKKARFFQDPSTNRTMLNIVTTLKNMLVVGLGFSLGKEGRGKTETFKDLGASLVLPPLTPACPALHSVSLSPDGRWRGARGR